MNSNDSTPDSDAADNPEDFCQSAAQAGGAGASDSAADSASYDSPPAADNDIPVSAAAKECETTREAFDDLVRSAKDAFRSGSDDARDAARKAIPKAREGFNTALHDLAYGLAYGLSFGSTLAQELAPEAMRNGFSEGSSAGREKAESFVEKQRQASAGQSNRANSTHAPVDDPQDPAAPSHGDLRDDDDASGEPAFV